MAIETLNAYMAAPKQILSLTKTASMTAVAANFQDVIAIAGEPGAGTLAGSNTANGVVPTDATAGFPIINAFSGGAKGYLTRLQFANSVACRIRLYDCLFKAGAYAYNASTTLASQPSFASRIPTNQGYSGLELWVEGVTAFTGNMSVAITYTDQDGNAGATTGTVATGIAPIVGRMIQIPLAAGDSGLRMVESVTATVASAGTFNILVLRPLWEGNIRIANGGGSIDLFGTGMPEVFSDSALLMTIAPDSTATGVPSILAEIANG